jgi:hypothetical protein
LVSSFLAGSARTAHGQLSGAYRQSVTVSEFLAESGSTTTKDPWVIAGVNPTHRRKPE